MRVSLCLTCLTGAMSAACLAAEVPPSMRAVIEKSAAFGLGRYPISFWSYTNLNEHGQYMDEAEVEEWADAGFTVPQSPSFDPTKPEQVAHIRQLLDWAQARGMKLIVCDPRTYARWMDREGTLVVPDDYAAGIQAALRDFGDHPALFGFHVGDEPGAAEKDAFFSCLRMQKELAPALHPFANLLPHFPGIEERAGTDTWPNYLDEFSRESTADLVSYDCYAQMNPGQAGWQDYYRNLRLYREASVRNGIPFWNTVLSVGHFNYRCPSYDDIRWQFNTTVASGAHGVLWFFYYMREPHVNYRLSPVDEHWNRTPTYDSIRRVQRSFNRFYGDLFTRLVSTRVTFSPDPFGGGAAFTPNGIVSRLQPETTPLLLGEFADLEGRRYVMLVNNSVTDNAHVSITFPGADARAFSYDWSGHEYEGNAYSADSSARDGNGLTISHFLAPGEEAVYRVESTSAAAEPIAVQ